MKIKFWGVRGSIGSAITSDEVESKIRRVLTLASPADILTPLNIDNFLETLPFSLKGTYGGNTTCVEVRSNNDDVFIIDGGTGLRRLGLDLMKEERMRGNANINFLFTHSHWDHIQGLMFFPPVYIPGNNVNFFSCVENMEERLRYQQVKTHFPIGFDDFNANKTFTHFKEGEIIKKEGIEILGKSVRHPGGCYSYKLKEDDKSFIFCSDAEFNIEFIDDIQNYVEYFKDADVLVFDTQYTFEESLHKIDWGHSSAAIATDLALKSNVKTLVLFHHEPTYNDDKMDEVTLQALKYKEMMARDSELKIVTAYEGLEINI